MGSDTDVYRGRVQAGHEEEKESNTLQTVQHEQRFKLLQWDMLDIWNEANIFWLLFNGRDHMPKQDNSLDGLWVWE